jgi:hypothetical protein
MVEEMRTWFAWQGVATLNVRVVVNEEVASSPALPPSGGAIRVSASHNNRQQGTDNVQHVIDNNPYTRWSTGLSQRPGMWFQIDLGEVRTVSQLRLDNDRSPRDYPRGYVVKVSLDEQEWMVVAKNELNDQPLNVTFSPREARFIRIDQTGNDSVFWWSIHGFDISGEIKMGTRASHNNVMVGADNLAQALDGRPETRWSSRVLQQPGMWFEIDLNEVQTVSGLALDTAGSPQDYPRGYVVRLATEHDQWQEVARNDHNEGPLEVRFSPREARYIRIEQTGRTDGWWWSIHGVTVRSDPYRPPSRTVRASHNDVMTGTDNLAQVLDGRPETRWSTQAGQQPGMWFEIDLSEVQTVSGLALDTAGSPQDYPRGYIVRLATEPNQWQEVARNDHNEGAFEVRFSPRDARYIRIEQTARTDGWWWSIHGVTVRSDPYKPSRTAKASHNNVLVGADNLSQALDDRPETRWSTRAGQQPGMWFEIDLNEVQTVSGLTLDTTGSPQDYPRGYIVRLATEHDRWQEVARNDHNEGALEVSFSPRAARYIRIEQTGRTDGWWWSIHGIIVKT